MLAGMGGQNILSEFKPSGTQYALAVRLSGKFKTAFPGRKAERPEERKQAR